MQFLNLGVIKINVHQQHFVCKYVILIVILFEFETLCNITQNSLRKQDELFLAGTKKKLSCTCDQPFRLMCLNVALSFMHMIYEICHDWKKLTLHLVLWWHV